KKNKIEAIEIIEPEIDEEIEKGAMIGAYSSMAIKFAKDLINDAPQVVTPLYVAQTAESVAKEYGLEWEVFNKDKIKQLNMNAFLAVGQGSVNEPKFVHLCYKPKKEPAKKIALIGKGITFDAGGMDIKPAQSMLTMKSDMSGAASVLGIIQAISKLNSEVEVHAICALCENMTSGSAYKPGDVVVASNGKSIEIENTDAEGRLTLADALCFADSLEVDEVIDIATLTGAVIPALGCNITAILGNNQQQMDTFKHCARKSAENVWQMPILDELKDNLKSDIADFKNTGGRAAGTSTAAWFLSNFTKSNAWMHLDIAGTAYSEKTNKEGAIGATGVMIRSLINYILN
ncbi:leucyl aminopeptidase, partial [bacterium]|nr:leucyl aminopeptidase [bacterium]